MTPTRRDFGKGLVALGAVAAPPAASARAAAAPISTARTRFMYGWAAMTVRQMRACSPAQLARRLQVTPDLGAALHGELIRRGVLASPVAGLSRVIDPVWPGGQNLARPTARAQAMRLADLDPHSLPEPARPDPEMKAADPAETETDPAGKAPLTEQGPDAR